MTSVALDVVDNVIDSAVVNVESDVNFNVDVNVANHRQHQYGQRRYCNRLQHLSDSWRRSECQPSPTSSFFVLIIVVVIVAESAGCADRGGSGGA